MIAFLLWALNQLVDAYILVIVVNYVHLETMT